MEIINVLGSQLPLKVSPNFLKNAACPLNLKLRYIDKVVDRFTKVAATRGAAVHLAIANLTKLCQQRGVIPSALNDEDVAQAVSEATPHEIYAELGTVLEWTRLWRDRFFLDARNLVGFEEKFAINEKHDECDWDTASYRGIVDVIHRDGKMAIVTDYKSQPNVLSQTALDEHDQGSFYAWMVNKFYPQFDEFVFRINYLRYGFTAETYRSMDQIKAFERKMLMQIDKIRDIKSWDPIPGEHCNLCDFIDRCPVAQDAGDLPPAIITADQALRIGSQLRVKEEWTKKAKAMLKTYVDGSDNVTLGSGGYVYGYRASEKVTWKVDLLKAVLLEAGIPLEEVVTVNANKMKKVVKDICRRVPELEEQLMAAKVIKAATKFGGFEPTDGPDDSTPEAE